MRLLQMHAQAGGSLPESDLPSSSGKEINPMSQVHTKRSLHLRAMLAAARVARPSPSAQ